MRRKPRRARWPLQFDLEGVPQDQKERKKLIDGILKEERRENAPLEETEEIEMSPVTPTPQNFFAADANTEVLIDINNPKTPRYGTGQNPKREYPRIVYHHDTGHILQVSTKGQHEAAKNRGFVDQPSDKFDYHGVRSGMKAPVKEVGPEREQPLTAEDLEAMEAAQLAELEQDQADAAESPEDADAAVAAALGEQPRRRGRK